MVNSPPNNGNANDLYLKGEGYDSEGKAIDFDEKIVGAGHSSGGSDLRWQLTVYGSGNFKLGEIGGAEGSDYGEDDIECGKDWFIVEKPTYEGEGDWEKAVAKVKFELSNCSEVRGRRECEIKIAEVKNLLIKRYESSLAFKSEWSGIAQNDLYLKGQGYVNGESMNFDEKIKGAYHGVGEGEYRWQLKVFKSGTTRLESAGGLDYDEDINCSVGWFEVRGERNVGGGGLSKSVKGVLFKLSQCGETGGGRECDIEIAGKGNLIY